MIIVEVHVAPIGTGHASMGSIVAETVKVAKQRGVSYDVNPMGTTIEGTDLQQLLDVVAEMHETVFKQGAKRVITFVHIDDRRDKDLTMKYKVDSVKAKVA
jgi:uncharacterized protein (TIGR00106 family)